MKLMNENLQCIRLTAGFPKIRLECPEYAAKKPAKVVALLRDVRLAICPVVMDIAAPNSSRSRKRRRTDRPRRDAASAAIFAPSEWPANPIGGSAKRLHGVSNPRIDRRAGVAIEIGCPHVR
jgi:hypothetical protein